MIKIRELNMFGEKWICDQLKRVNIKVIDVVQEAGDSILKFNIVFDKDNYDRFNFYFHSAIIEGPEELSDRIGIVVLINKGIFETLLWPIQRKLKVF